MNVTNLYKKFCSELGVTDLSLSNVNSLLSSSGVNYNQTAQNYITSVVSIDRNMMPLIVPYFYVSLEHVNVTKNTYGSWIRTGYDVGKEYYAKNHAGEYGDWKTKIYYQSEKYDHSINRYSATRHTYTKYGGMDYENAFKNTGDFMAIGLHTLFDENLWMCEQGMITCKKEAQEQINDINLLPARSVISQHGGDTFDGKEEKLPVFPGTGCPWFTISDQNRVDFNIATSGITYWFTKNDYDATITIMLKADKKYDTYQSMSFGMLKTIDEQSHIFPLYIAGGSQGLSQDTYVYTPVSSSDNRQKPTNTGPNNVYDLDIDNIALSNSNLLSPTKFNKANMSNFRVLSPEGEWRDIYSMVQGGKLRATSSPCDDYVSNWAVLLENPTAMLDCHSGYFLSADNLNRVDIYSVNKPINKYDHSSKLENIIVFLNGDLNHNEVGCQGMVPNCYGSWFRTLPTGEVTLSGKKYLSVPNGWENRLWNYPAYVGFSNDSSLYENKSIKDKYDDLFNELKNGVMTHRLLIPLEDGA